MVIRRLVMTLGIARTPVESGCVGFETTNVNCVTIFIETFLDPQLKV